MTFLAPVPTARCAAARRKTSLLATAFVLAWAWEMSLPAYLRLKSLLRGQISEQHR